jgi:pantothenate kinase type III
VCTFSICGGGPVGPAGVVVVAVSPGEPLVGGAVTPGRARNLRSLTYGALKVTSGEPAALEREL